MASTEYKLTPPLVTDAKRPAEAIGSSSSGSVMPAAAEAVTSVAQLVLAQSRPPHLEPRSIFSRFYNCKDELGKLGSTGVAALMPVLSQVKDKVLRTALNDFLKDESKIVELIEQFGVGVTREDKEMTNLVDNLNFVKTRLVNACRAHIRSFKECAETEIPADGNVDSKVKALGLAILIPGAKPEVASGVDLNYLVNVLGNAHSELQTRLQKTKSGEVHMSIQEIFEEARAIAESECKFLSGYSEALHQRYPKNSAIEVIHQKYSAVCTGLQLANIQELNPTQDLSTLSNIRKKMELEEQTPKPLRRHVPQRDPKAAAGPDNS